MMRLSPSFDASVSAFRDMTAQPGDGAATRARILVRAEREARRRGLVRRTAIPLAVGLVVLLSGGAALTAAGLRWRAPAPAKIAAEPEGAAQATRTAVSRPTRIVPALGTDDAPAQPDRAAGERQAYERAHRDHFFGGAPATALAAWDAYLAAYPRGTFAPEARYNRALCLVRLERFAAAAQALRPFARGRLGGYRRHESCALLRWLSERDAGVAAEPSCAAPM